MGMRIHYRGTVDDLSRVDQMKDRVMDLMSGAWDEQTW